MHEVDEYGAATGGGHETGVGVLDMPPQPVGVAVPDAVMDGMASAEDEGPDGCKGQPSPQGACGEAPTEGCAPAGVAGEPSGGPAQAEGGEPQRRKPIGELTRRELGDEGEEWAARRLDAHGWTILERNWRCKYGEVDIVALDDETDPEHETAVLVEVKTRLSRGRDDVVPEIAVDARKRQRYRQLGRCYLAEHPEVESVRFDVIAIVVSGEGKAKLRHIKSAFVLEER